MLAAPLGQRPHRLSLKVDDKYVVVGNENLAQMVVAMDAGSFDIDLCRHQIADLRHQILAAAKQAIGRLLRSVVQPRSSLVQNVENEARAGTNGLRPVEEVIGLKRLGCKGHVIGVNAERTVQFSRTLSETVRERDELLLGPAAVPMLAPDDFHSLGDIRPAVAL